MTTQKKGKLGTNNELDAFERVKHEETGEGVQEKYPALSEALAREAA